MAGARVFYNNSAFDGNDPAANAADDAAVSLPVPNVGKRALLPGARSRWFHVTNYTKGINGIMVDVSDPGGTRQDVAFSFKIGATDDPDSWAAAPPVAERCRRAIARSR